jgi:hypothetical protein
LAFETSEDAATFGRREHRVEHVPIVAVDQHEGQDAERRYDDREYGKVGRG